MKAGYILWECAKTLFIPAIILLGFLIKLNIKHKKLNADFKCIDCCKDANSEEEKTKIKLRNIDEFYSDENKIFNLIVEGKLFKRQTVLMNRSRSLKYDVECWSFLITAFVSFLLSFVVSISFESLKKDVDATLSENSIIMLTEILFVLVGILVAVLFCILQKGIFSEETVTDQYELKQIDKYLERYIDEKFIKH